MKLHVHAQVGANASNINYGKGGTSQNMSVGYCQSRVQNVQKNICSGLKDT